MTKHFAKLGVLALGAALVLSGCARKPDPAVVRQQIAAMDFTQATQPLLVADFRSAGVIGIVGKSGVNGTVESWASADGVGLSLDEGILVRTAGTGHNLLIANAAPTKAALAGQGGGTYHRVYKNLTGDNKIRERVFDCQMQGPETVSVKLVGKPVTARQWVERCSSATESFANTYWQAGARGIVKSDQWLPDNGYVTLDRP